MFSHIDIEEVTDELKTLAMPWLKCDLNFDQYKHFVHKKLPTNFIF